MDNLRELQKDPDWIINARLHAHDPNYMIERQQSCHESTILTHSAELYLQTAVDKMATHFLTQNINNGVEFSDHKSNLILSLESSRLENVNAAMNPLLEVGDEISDRLIISQPNSNTNNVKESKELTNSDSRETNTIEESTLLKHPPPPKKPLSPYMHFSKMMWNKVKQSNPNFGICDIGGMIGRMWRKMTYAERQKFKQQFTSDKERYDREIKTYLLETGLNLSEIGKYRIKKNRSVSDWSSEFDDEDVELGPWYEELHNQSKEQLLEDQNNFSQQSKDEEINTEMITSQPISWSNWNSFEASKNSLNSLSSSIDLQPGASMVNELMSASLEPGEYVGPLANGIHTSTVSLDSDKVCAQLLCGVGPQEWGDKLRREMVTPMVVSLDGEKRMLRGALTERSKEVGRLSKELDEAYRLIHQLKQQNDLYQNTWTRNTNSDALMLVNGSVGEDGHFMLNQDQLDPLLNSSQSIIRTNDTNILLNGQQVVMDSSGRLLINSSSYASEGAQILLDENGHMLMQHPEGQFMVVKTGADGRLFIVDESSNYGVGIQDSQRLSDISNINSLDLLSAAAASELKLFSNEDFQNGSGCIYTNQQDSISIPQISVAGVESFGSENKNEEQINPADLTMQEKLNDTGINGDNLRQVGVVMDLSDISDVKSHL